MLLYLAPANFPLAANTRNTLIVLHNGYSSHTREREANPLGKVSRLISQELGATHKGVGVNFCRKLKLKSK